MIVYLVGVCFAVWFITLSLWCLFSNTPATDMPDIGDVIIASGIFGLVSAVGIHCLIRICCLISQGGAM